MKKFNLNLLQGMALVMVFTCFTTAAYSQVFWDETFADGIPADWNNEDLQNNGGEWTWCDNPSGAAGNCPGVFSGQQPFAATTAADGFATVASDFIGAPSGSTHTSELTTSAINCTDYPNIFLSFQSAIGTFELNAAENAILQVSTDGTVWTDFTVFPNLTGAQEWGLNPEVSVIDISAVAGSQPTVYLRWHWNAGWEYHWNLDDITLSADNPLPADNMRVNGNWFATALNSQVPISQIEPFGFIADIENIGSGDQTNVGLNVTIVDDANPGTSVYDQTLDYGTVLAGELIENQLFPDAGYTAAPSPATYTGTYSISADAADVDLDDNERSFTFEVTEEVFAKDTEPWITVSPAGGNWDPGEAHSWSYANFFHTPNGDGMWATEASFALGNANATEGEQILIKLFKWVDVDEDGNVGSGSDERTWLGYNPYVIGGTEAQNELITVPILNVADDSPGVMLEDGANYVLAVEYVDVNGKDFFLMGSSNNDYGAAIFRTQELGAPRYAGMLGVNQPLDSEPLSWVGFGWDLVPVIRMTVSDQGPTNVATVLDDENVIEVFPNPASEFINVNIELVDMHNAVTVEIADISGKVIEQRSYNDFQQDQLRFELNKFAAGSYFLNVTTPEGQKSAKFTVVR